MQELDLDALRAAAGLEALALQAVARCASTNAELLARPPRARPFLLAAAEQTAGRGRRGRRWYAEPGASIAFSLGCLLTRPLRELAPLTLVAGVATAEALRALGAEALRLKWPNDLVVHGAKLGGILVETRAAAGGVYAVIGIGLNWRRSATLAQRLRRRIAALEDCVAPLPSREAVIGAIARALVPAVEAFDARGFGTWRSRWLALAEGLGARLRLRLAGGGTASGRFAGLEPDGALRLATRAGERTYAVGNIVTARTA